MPPFVIDNYCMEYGSSPQFLEHFSLNLARSAKTVPVLQTLFQVTINSYRFRSQFRIFEVSKNFNIKG